MRLKTEILLQAIIDHVAERVPEAEHYKGSLKEGFSRPAFLYVPIYAGEQKLNYTTSQRELEFQIIYYGKTDGYEPEDFVDRMLVQEALEGFLNQFHMKADDRDLKFIYETKNADGQMAYYLTFRFLDEAFDQQMVDDEAMEAAESMDVNANVTGR